MKATDNMQLFEQFLPKESRAKKHDGIIYAVTYTRVSSLEQFKSNGSLESQERICKRLAEQMKVPVLAKFGGTYESAKTEERKAFQQMMDFIKKSKENIKYIIVSDSDRFSRTGANAIYLAEQLRKKGIQVLAASSPMDTLTPIGAFQQNIQLLFSHFDNQLRRDKTIRGMMQKFEQGLYIGSLPMGYERRLIDGEKHIVINQTGEAIVKAFKWKAERGLRTSQIAARLEKLGFPIKEKRLSDIFRNVFYCGLLSNSMLKEKIVEGKNWQPLVSKEIFLKANEVLKQFHMPHDYHKENENVPLRKFVACAKCGTMWTGYIVKRKSIYYYKCNRKGCKSNLSANKMHEQFITYLQGYEISNRNIEPLKRQLQLTFEYMNHALYQQKAEIEKRRKDILLKMNNAEDKYMEDADMDKEVYHRYRDKCKEQLAKIAEEERHLAIPLSNSEKFIDFSVSLCQNLSKIWASGNLNNKMKLQKMMFPDGLSYDLPNNVYRTKRVNSIILQISHLARLSAQNKTRNLVALKQNSALVVSTGIEPVSKV